MANASSSFVTPNHEGPSRFTPKFHRCLGHVRDANAKRGTDYEEYGVCTASIGYAGSYTAGHRRGARTPAGRARKMRESRADLTKRFGITQFEPGYIGFNPAEQRWYGWSHRAVAGFGVGSRVRKGDALAEGSIGGGKYPVGYTAKTLDDAKRMARAFAEAVG